MTEKEKKHEKEVLAVLNDLIVEIQSATIEKIAKIIEVTKEILDSEK